MMELNEKLARWAGIEHKFERLDIMHPMKFCRQCDSAYHHGDSKIVGEVECTPDFTSSLDACFKWLVPKLEPLNYDLEISNDCEMLGWSVCLHNLKSGCSAASPKVDFEEPSGAALALCKAIEQLIDKETDGS